MWHDNLTNYMFEKPSQAEAFLTAVLVGTTILATIFGNSLVLYTFGTDRRVRRVQYRFIASLAVADLLVGSVIMPTTLAYKLLAYWPLGTFICELWLAADVLLCTASMQHICVIGIDRYLTLAKPIHYCQSRGNKVVNGLIGLVWFISLMIALPPLVGWRPSQRENSCDLSTDTGYILYSACGSFYIPLIVTTVVYYKIWRVTRERQATNRRCLVHKHQLIKHTTERVSKSRQKLLPKNWSAKIRKMQKQRQTAPLPAMPKNNRSCPAHLFLYENAAFQTVNINPDERRVSCVAKLYHNNTSKVCRIAPKVQEISDTHSDTHTKSIESIELPALVHRINLTDSKQSTKAPRKQRNAFSLHGSRADACFAAEMFQTKIRIIRRREKQSALLLVSILIAFVICWLPFFVIYILRGMGIIAPEIVFNVFFFLGYINSALNPILYAVINAEFRTAFKKSLEPFMSLKRICTQNCQEKIGLRNS